MPTLHFVAVNVAYCHAIRNDDSCEPTRRASVVFSLFFLEIRPVFDAKDGVSFSKH